MEHPGAPEQDDVPSRFQVDFTGKTLGAYRIEKRIAKGAMGAVYLAEDTGLGMRVVVKVPHTRFLGEEGFRARFRREITELVRLEHPHVVRILARGEEDEVPYFVLQYLGGGSLEERIEKGGRQTLPAALAWLRPIATTLDFVHARGIVHRDVKPGNILFDEQDHVFLSDFGLVKALDRPDEGKQTEAGTGIGSPLYMAPEQGIGREVTAAADQYGLASTLYESLASRPPFRGATVVETLLMKQRDAAPGIRALAPDVPPASEAAIQRALDRDPAKRFPSCAAFAEEVARPFAAEEARAPSRRRTAAITVSGLLVAALAGGAATGWFGLAKGNAASPAAAEAVGSAIVVLADAGREPRIAYRYRPLKGATDRFTLHNLEVNRVAMPPMLNPRTVRDQEVSLSVSTVEKDGRIGLEWKLRAPRSGGGEGIPDDQIAAEQKIYDGIGDVRAASTLTTRGEVLDVRVMVEKVIDPDLQQFVPGYEETVRTIEVVLPTEPIGVGAIWDVTKAASFVDMRYQQTTTYEVVAVEGSRLRLKFDITIGAPPQRFHPPGAPEGITVRVLSMKASGKGTTLVDPSRPVPVEWAGKQNIELSFELPLQSRESEPRKLEFGGTYEATIRRD